MSPAEIRSAVIEIARQELGLVDGLPEQDLSAHLDSVQKLSLVVGIEDRFEICFSPEDDAGIDSLDDIVSLVGSRLAAANRSDGVAGETIHA